MGRQREGAEMGSRRGNGKEVIAAGEPFPDGRVRTPARPRRGRGFETSAGLLTGAIVLNPNAKAGSRNTWTIFLPFCVC